MMGRLRDAARAAANSVMTGSAPGARATTMANSAAHIAADGGHTAAAAAVGIAGALVVAAEQVLGTYEGGYATFDTDRGCSR